MDKVNFICVGCSSKFEKLSEYDDHLCDDVKRERTIAAKDAEIARLRAALAKEREALGAMVALFDVPTEEWSDYPATMKANAGCEVGRICRAYAARRAAGGGG